MSKGRTQTKQEVILEVWKDLARESVGAAELSLMRRALEVKFGQGGVESPAGLARILADAGVRLRHPEVLDADVEWRLARIHELFEQDELDFATIKSAIDSARRLEELGSRFQSEDDEIGFERLVKEVRELKSDLSVTGGKIGREVAEWLTVWLQNPTIFVDWLALRTKSFDFHRKFGLSDTPDSGTFPESDANRV